MKSVNNIIVISDTHCGCQLGLCPPKVQLDNGGFYYHSDIQKKVWKMWEHFWNVWVPTVTKGEPYIVVHNGDAVDGVHHGSVTQISHNITDQIQIAKQVLEPVIQNKKCVAYYHIRGTEAHVGKSGASEEGLAKALGARPDSIGNYARWELWLKLHGNLVHFSHHIGTTQSANYESTAPYKEYIESLTDAARWNNKPPDVIVRSHRHRAIETRIPTDKGYGISVITPAWQLKCLGLDTELPTKSGWTTMEKVSIGDVLFDENGKQCNVIAVSDIMLKEKCYVVEFSNGEKVKASDDHLWLTTASVDKPNQKGRGHTQVCTRIRTTQEIYNTLAYGKNNRNNHKLKMPLPLELDHTELPIDPYVLGCWLGDGDSDSTRLTSTTEDAIHYKKEFEKKDYTIVGQNVSEGKCPRFSIRKISNGVLVGKGSKDNLTKVLRSLGLLNNKHIPLSYLRASSMQRLSLLQGLMDTDGQTDGRSLCLFTTVNEQLKSNVCELMASLGIKYRATLFDTKIDGRIVGKCWKIQFFIASDILKVFSLPRKQDHVPLSTSRKFGSKSRSVTIRSVTPCEPTLMRCIGVDSPSKLYRFGKSMLYTHNTPFTYRIALGRVSMPQIGGILIRHGDEDSIFTRSKVWNIQRSKEEVI